MGTGYRYRGEYTREDTTSPVLVNMVYWSPCTGDTTRKTRVPYTEQRQVPVYPVTPTRDYGTSGHWPGTSIPYRGLLPY